MRQRVTTLLTLAATTACTAALMAAPQATAGVAAHLSTKAPAQVIVEDGLRAVKGPTVNDIYRVSAYAASTQEPAAVTVHTNGSLRPGQAITIWFNFDKDAEPEAGVGVTMASEYRLFKANGWKPGKTLAYNCGGLSDNGFDLSFEFSPVCMGAKRGGKMAVSVLSETPGYRTDFVPGIHKWSRKLRTYA